MRAGVDCFANIRIGRFRVDGSLYCADDFAGIEPDGRNAERRELGGDNLRREEFSVALDGIQAGIAEFSQEENAAGDSFKRTEQPVDRLPDRVAVPFRE